MTMLVYGTQSPKRGGISQDLLATYVRYKQDTRAIIDWLLMHGTHKYRNLKTISIRDMLSLAEIVQRKAVAMPDAIDFQFREAIAARTEISRHFRQSKEADLVGQETTINHEFFTTSLEQIYTGLCECCARPEINCRNAQMKRAANETKHECNNRYEVLNPGHHDLDCQFYGTASNGQHRRDASTPEIVKTKTRTGPHLVDFLSDMFEIQKEVQEMHDLLFAMTTAWEQAACQKLSIVVAAFISNAAFAVFEGVEQRLKILCNCSNPDILSARFAQIGNTANADEGDEGTLTSAMSNEVEALRTPWHLLLQLKENHLGQVQESSGATSFSQITVRKGPNSAPMDRDVYATLVGNISQHVRAKRHPTSIVLTSTPLFADVGYLVTHDDIDTNGLRCAFGLQAVLETYKSYLLAPQCTNAPSNCRLQALRFAQETAASLAPVLNDASMPCRCCQTLASHLEGFKIDLETFFQEKVFDLYFQSPWVSGSHILEMLENSFYFGLRLFSYRHYCGAVLHVYNVLRKLTGFRNIPLLDHLCTVFDDILFPGGIPDRNFKACCMRYMGGRLRFNAQSPNHKSGSHKMEIPVHSAKATAGFGLRKEANDARFQYRKISLLHHVKHDKGYHLDEPLWNRVHDLASSDGDQSTEKTKKRRSCPHHHRNLSAPLSHSTPHRLCDLQKAVTTEFSGPFPIARVNFFAIYTACVRIVGLISDHAHEEGEQGSRCLCFLDMILSAADRVRDDGYRLQPFGCKALREGCERAILEVLGEVGVEGFLWGGV